jgi:hypothetical protein
MIKMYSTEIVNESMLSLGEAKKMNKEKIIKSGEI